ncbi:MAG: Gfo/Idh/MocA family oxidoreductase [Thermoguttaceae bacterium]|jgi:predicted dehydrogenase|nr:Gfo/Idh/MocA family oxidoreductase [Thermoguttaceae bacterium]
MTRSMKAAIVLASMALLAVACRPASTLAEEPIRVGIIGLDTSHAPAYTKLLNQTEDDEELAGARVVAANVKGSYDLEVSVVRQPGITEQMEKFGVPITGSIGELLEKVDTVILTTNDGHPRLSQTLQVLRARKPVFVDKPASASLADLIAIYDAAKQLDVPIFTSSSLRYIENAAEDAAGEHGQVLGVDTYGPASMEPSHPDLYWYLIHAVEPLVAIMGPDIESVSRTHTEGQDVVVARWKDGRIGTVRGMRQRNPGFGGTVFTDKGTFQLGASRGYRPLVVDILRMFRTGEVAVPVEQSIAIYALMDAADESKRLGGAPVSVPDLIAKAREKAVERLKEANAELDKAAKPGG